MSRTRNPDSRLGNFARSFRSWLRLTAVAEGKIKGQSEEAVEEAKEKLEAESVYESEVRVAIDAASFGLYMGLKDGDEKAWLTAIKVLYIVRRKRAFDMIDGHVARLAASNKAYATLIAMSTLVSEKKFGKKTDGRKGRGKFFPAIKFDGDKLEKPEVAAHRLFSALLKIDNTVLGSVRVRRSIIIESCEQLAESALMSAEELLRMIVTIFADDEAEMGELVELFVGADLMEEDKAIAVAGEVMAGKKATIAEDEAEEDVEDEDSADEDLDAETAKALGKGGMGAALS